MQKLLIACMLPFVWAGCSSDVGTTPDANTPDVETTPGANTPDVNPETTALPAVLNEQPEGMYAQIETDKGTMLLVLEMEKTPLTVANFVGLAEGTFKTAVRPEGPYYDGLTFHRVISDFMIQGGCPQGTGMGDPGYKFRDEIDPSLLHDGPGILSMANGGPGANGSQFFITHKATPWLNGRHSVFGHIVKGQNVVNAITQGDKIRHIKILRKGAKARNFKADEVFAALVKSGAD